MTYEEAVRYPGAMYKLYGPRWTEILDEIDKARLSLERLKPEARVEFLSMISEGCCSHCGQYRDPCPCMRDE